MLPELSRTAPHPFPHTALAKPYESLAAPHPHTASTEKIPSSLCVMGSLMIVLQTLLSASRAPLRAWRFSASFGKPFDLRQARGSCFTWTLEIRKLLQKIRRRCCVLTVADADADKSRFG